MALSLNPLNWFFKNQDEKETHRKIEKIELSSSGPHSFNNSPYQHFYYGGGSGQKYPGGLPNYGATNYINNRGTRQNARSSFHDTPEAKGLVNRFADTVVDQGLKLECTPSNEILGLSMEEAEKWAEDVEERFHLWAKGKSVTRNGITNLYQLQRLYHIAQQRDNDIFVRFYYSREKGLQNPLQLQMVDPNQIVGDSITSTYADSFTYDGIEREVSGREKSYHIFTKNHKTGEYKTQEVPRVGPKSKKTMMIHAFMPEYAGQGRGYSRLEHILQEFHDVTDFKISNIKKAISQSQITMYTKPSQDEDSTNPFEDNVTSGPQRNKILDIDHEDGVTTTVSADDCVVDFNTLDEVNFSVPGSTGVFNLKKGQDLIPFQTQPPSEAFSAFVDSYMSYVSASTGMPLEVLLMKFGQNYSASRGALILFWGVVGIFREEMATDFLNEVYEAWLSEEIAAGRVNAAGFNDPVLKKAWLNCKWIGSPMPNIDPKRTADADKTYVEMGATNLDRVARNLNGSSGKANRQKLVRQYEELPTAPWNGVPETENNEEDE